MISTGNKPKIAPLPPPEETDEEREDRLSREYHPCCWCNDEPSEEPCCWCGK